MRLGPTSTHFQTPSIALHGDMEVSVRQPITLVAVKSTRARQLLGSEDISSFGAHPLISRVMFSPARFES